MGFFDKLLKKKPETVQQTALPPGQEAKKKTETKVDPIKQKVPVKGPEGVAKLSSNKWNDPEYLRKLNASLKNNSGKSVMQVINDIEQELAPKRQQTSKGSTDLAAKTEESQISTPFSVKITTQWVESEPFEELTHLEFGKPSGVIGCFLNYSTFRVVGMNECGKRCLKIRTGVNAQQAIEKAKSEGLSEPFETEVMDFDPPTDRQIECLKSHGTFIPDGITKDDASCMISRLVGDDDLRSPTPWLVALANGLNTEFSAFIGARGLFSSVIYQVNDRDRAALYAYAVRRSMKGAAFRNMLDDPEVDEFYDFADQVIASPSLLKSLKSRDVHDFQRPHKGTAIYKAAAAHFAGGGA